ncbi:alpha/beta hydrolase [Virgisporangium ochraceum]|uniref:Lipase n=1 Tax=Virgisporangium ochraceum TaxID=65505 RepID=A0A8J3ZLP9_9ACTN|nr:lipase [Virgisporangium ochraceum]
MLRYGDHPDHVIDLRLPATQTGPLVIFVHGGFWRAAYDRAHAGPLAADLAARGYPVACPEYRRVGQSGGGWPGTLDDVAAALAALPDLVRPHADPAGAILVGHSAGGHLALLNAHTPGLAGVVALAPVADLGAAYRAGIGSDAIAALLGGGPHEVPSRFDRADPARRGPLPVPTVIIHGDADDSVPVENSAGYAASVAGDLCRITVLSGVDHFALIDPLSPTWENVVTAVGELR